MRRAFSLICLMSISLPSVILPSEANAWEGYDQETGMEVEIESGYTVREGLDTEIYNYNDHSWHDVSVEDMTNYGDAVVVEVYDYDSAEYRTFEMEREW